MILLAHSTYNSRTIEAGLGLPEYSYWFVRRAFTRLLNRFGIVVPVADPAQDVNEICAAAALHGESCVFLSFDPPQKTLLGLHCPTIPIFAWEFDTIPNEAWGGDTREDWRSVLGAVPAAITHSSYAADAVRRQMGQDFPIWSIPAPVHAAHARHAATARGWQASCRLHISGIAVDAGNTDLGPFGADRAQSDGVRALRALAQHRARHARTSQTLHVSGVVYTAVFNPADGRKNWLDLLAGFVAAFRTEPGATLILKLTHHDPVESLLPVLRDIAKLGDFLCRIVLIHGLLPAGDYESLVATTSYCVNTSSGEGQCLPLMEFMSAGRPAITPCHTAMLDYVTAENAFIVESHARPAAWPHDPRQALRCLRFVPGFTDLVRAYRESYAVACDAPARYARMSAAATLELKRFCGDDVVFDRMADVLTRLAPARQNAARRMAVGD